MSESESNSESRVKAVLNDDLLAVLAPVLDWYQSDEHPDREPLDILRDIVDDLQSDRADSIALGIQRRYGRARVSTAAATNCAGVISAERDSVRCDDWLCAGWRFTKHSLQRYRERTGCKKSNETVMRRLVDKLASRKRLGRRQWYACGWVFVLRGRVVITIMRPREASLQRRIFKAHNDQMGDAKGETNV